MPAREFRVNHRKGFAEEHTRIQDLYVQQAGSRQAEGHASESFARCLRSLRAAPSIPLSRRSSILTQRSQIIDPTSCGDRKQFFLCDDHSVLYHSLFSSNVANFIRSLRKSFESLCPTRSGIFPLKLVSSGFQEKLLFTQLFLYDTIKPQKIEVKAEPSVIRVK